MANLAHRASQFMEKKFLIIHPTADGKSSIAEQNKFLEEYTNLMFHHLSSQKKSISNIQQNSSPSSSMKRLTTPYRYVVVHSAAADPFSLPVSYFPGSVVLQP